MEMIQCVLKGKTCAFQLLRLAGHTRQIKSLAPSLPSHPLSLPSLPLLRRIFFHLFPPPKAALFKEEAFVYLNSETNPFFLTLCSNPIWGEKRKFPEMGQENENVKNCAAEVAEV